MGNEDRAHGSVGSGHGAREVRGTVANEVSGSAGTAIQAGTVTGNINSFNISLLPPPRYTPSWQVPVEDPGFVNRTVELGQMDTALDAPAAVPAALLFLLLGPAGVGKTELSRRFAARLRRRFPDGGYYVRLAEFRGLGGAVDLNAVLGELLVALGSTQSALPATLQARTVMYRARVADLRVLLVVDDAEFAGQVRLLAPGEHGVMVVTSQRKLPELRGRRVAVLEVGPLGQSEGVELLADQIGSGRVQAEPEAAAALVDLCEGLPVLLRAVCAQLVSRPHRSLSGTVERLRGAAERARVLEHNDAFAVLDLTYDDLPPTAAAVYRVLGLMPGRTVNTTAVAVAAQITVAEAAAGLDELVELCLLEELGPSRFAAHAIIRAHAVSLASRSFPEGDRNALVRRVVEWYLACGQAADEYLAPVRLRLPGRRVTTAPGYATPAFASDREVLNWLEEEHGNLIACVHASAEHLWDELTWLLCDPLWSLYQNHKHYAAWTEAFALALAAAERAEQRWVCARLRCMLTRAYTELAQFTEAAKCIGPALGLARVERDLLLEASVLEFAGIAEREAGNPARALELFDAGRDVLAGGEPTVDTGRADLILRYHSGRALVATGRLDEAAEILQTALREAEDGDPRLAGRVRLAYADVLVRLGHADRAKVLAAAAAQEAGRRKVPIEQVRALRILARACSAAGEDELSRGYDEHADALQSGLEGRIPADL